MSNDYQPSAEAQSALDRVIGPEPAGGNLGFGYPSPVRVLFPEPKEPEPKLERVTDGSEKPEPQVEEVAKPTEPEQKEQAPEPEVTGPDKAKPYDYKSALGDLTKALGGEQAEEIAKLQPQEQVSKLTELYQESQQQIADLQADAETAVLKLDAPSDTWDPEAQLSTLVSDDSLHPFYDKLGDHFMRNHALENLEDIFKGVDDGTIVMHPDQQEPFTKAMHYLWETSARKAGLSGMQEMLDLISAYKQGLLVMPRYGGSGAPETATQAAAGQNVTGAPAGPGTGQYVPPSWIAAQAMKADGFADDHPTVVALEQQAHREKFQYDQDRQRSLQLTQLERDFNTFKQNQEEASSNASKLSESSQLAHFNSDLEAELEDYLADVVGDPPAGYDRQMQSLWTESLQALDSHSAASVLKEQVKGFYKNGQQNMPAARMKMVQLRAAFDDAVKPIVDWHMENIREIEEGRKLKAKAATGDKQKVVPPQKAATAPTAQRSTTPRPVVNLNQAMLDIQAEGLETWADLEAQGLMPKIDLPAR